MGGTNFAVRMPVGFPVAQCAVRWSCSAGPLAGLFLRLRPVSFAWLRLCSAFSCRPSVAGPGGVAVDRAAGVGSGFRHLHQGGRAQVMSC